MLLDLADLNIGDFTSITMLDILDPKSWKVKDKWGLKILLTDRTNALMFFPKILREYRGQELWVSVSQDFAGGHKFVSLNKANEICMGKCEETELELEDEEAVSNRPLNAVLLYAKPKMSQEELEAAMAPLDLSELTGAKHSIVRQLSLVDNFLIISNQETLCTHLPTEYCFDNLVLIVNCHESNPDPKMYKVGTCSTLHPPEVRSHALDTFWKNDSDQVGEICDEIQIAIWQALQQGSVAIHCMAGNHRSACIAACQFLYRYYTLGHTWITANHIEIFKTLQSVRPGVSPAYTDIVVHYEDYLKNRFGDAKSKMTPPANSASYSSLVMYAEDEQARSKELDTFITNRG